MSNFNVTFRSASAASAADTQSNAGNTKSAGKDDEAAETSTLPGASRAARLNSQTQWNQALQRLRSHIIQSNEQGLPRYGVLSILARRVPFHLFDHSALTKLSDTAFTDGVHVFVNTSFFKEVMGNDRSVIRIRSKHHPMLLILLHELSHILFRHHTRLPPKAPPLLWAISCDIAINIRLIQAYPQLKRGPVFDDAWGTKRSEIEKYQGLSEEYILHELWEDPHKDAIPLVDGIKDKLQQENEQSIKKQDDKRGKTQDIHNHLVSTKTLADALEKNSLDHVRKFLKLPDPNDKPAYQNLEMLNNINLAGDLDKAKELREQHPMGNAMAGEHLESASSQWIENSYEGKLEWRNMLRDLVVGQGNFYQHCDEIPHDIYYIDHEQMGLTTPLFIGTQTPSSPKGNIICVIDTSSSISLKSLRIFIGELNKLIAQEGSHLNNLYLTSADTTLRGEMLKFSQNDLIKMPEKVKLHGHGGTNIIRVLNETLTWANQQNVFPPDTLEAIIYFTDLIDKAPTRDDLPNVIPKLLFLSPPSFRFQSFRKSVASFANVVEIKDGTVIDLCES